MARKSAQYNINNPFKVFIGYDHHEDIEHEICKYSMRKHSSIALDIVPLNQKHMRDRGIYWRKKDPKQSTEFTYLRFFVPYLANYKGWAMFCDDDFIWNGDIAELVDLLDDSKALVCVNHEINTHYTEKLAGCVQEPYPRKNWSSMMLFNCEHPSNKALDLELINREGGQYLHRFMWLKDEEIGAVPYTWNFLVGWYEKFPEGQLPKVVHYTEGGPHFPDYRCLPKTDPLTHYHDEWLEYMKEYEALLPEKRLLGPYERLTFHGNKPLEGYPNSDDLWTWEKDKPFQPCPFPPGKEAGTVGKTE
eukprot:jgi/Mesvir1/2164/Mv16676-RA.1